MKVMIVVTHLLGTGHLARALTLGRAFRDAGHAVTLVSGGTPVPHFDASGLGFVQLPPVRSNGTDFTTLLQEDGTAAGGAYMQGRRDQALAVLVDTAPDIVITELFPFGRRILRAEFRALLETAQAQADRPLILSSIRDILAPPGKPAKAAFADDMITQFYDGVLVHSDPEVVALDQSWPVSDRLAARLHYTGFVAPPPPVPTRRAPRDSILVSAGGGSVGDRVFDAVIDAARLRPQVHWLLLVGGNDARRRRLAARAPAHVSVRPPRRDYRALLQGALASVSMCGYNTALDVMQTGVPSVLVPFDDGGEVEQSLRAEALSTLNGIAVLRQDALSGPAVLKALDDVQAAAPRPPRVTGMDGAARAVDIACALRAGRSG